MLSPLLSLTALSADGADHCLKGKGPEVAFLLAETLSSTAKWKAEVGSWESQ